MAEGTGISALAIACAGGHAACAAFLLEDGASLTLGDQFGQTAMHRAAEEGGLEVRPSLCCIKEMIRMTSPLPLYCFGYSS